MSAPITEGPNVAEQATLPTANDLAAFLDDNWCQCGALPDDQECYWHKLFDAARALEAAEKSLTARDDLLRLIEWNGHGGCCPVCSGWDVDPGRGCTPKTHTPTCELAAFIKGTK